MEASLGSSICTINSPLSILGKNSPPTNPAATRLNEPINKMTAIKSVANLVFQLFNAHSNIPETQCVKASIRLSNQRMIFPNKFLFEICSNFPNRDDNQGTKVNDAKYENAVAIITVTANCLMMLDTKSLLKV